MGTEQRHDMVDQSENECYQVIASLNDETVDCGYVMT